MRVEDYRLRRLIVYNLCIALDCQRAAGVDTAAVLAMFNFCADCQGHLIFTNHGISANGRRTVVADARALDVVAGNGVAADLAAVHGEVSFIGNIHARAL